MEAALLGHRLDLFRIPREFSPSFFFPLLPSSFADLLAVLLLLVDPICLPINRARSGTLSLSFDIDAPNPRLTSSLRFVLKQGYHGSLSLNEGFLYGLDTLPLLIAVVVFIPSEFNFHPKNKMEVRRWLFFLSS